MTVSLFVSILTLGAAASALLTEAVKKAYTNAGKTYSANIIALVDAVVIGAGGTSAVYMLLDIAWSVNNVICVLLMCLCVWIGSMIGYDKIFQLIEQLSICKRK